MNWKQNKRLKLEIFLIIKYVEFYYFQNEISIET